MRAERVSRERRERSSVRAARAAATRVLCSGAPREFSFTPMLPCSPTQHFAYFAIDEHTLLLTLILTPISSAAVDARCRRHYYAAAAAATAPRRLLS